MLIRCELYHLRRGERDGIIPLELVFKAAQKSGGHTRHIAALERNLQSLSAELPANAPALQPEDTAPFLGLVLDLCHQQVRTRVLAFKRVFRR